MTAEGVGAMLQLMADRPETELAFQAAEDRLDLRQLDIARPQHTGIATREVGAKQIVSVAQLRLFELGPIHADLKRLARHRLTGVRQLYLHKTEGAARLGLGGAGA